MKTTVNLYQFRDAFRSIRPDNFSYEGLEILFEYLEQLGDDIGEEIELDVIAICCDFSEDTPSTIAEQYNIEAGEDDDLEYIVQTWLEDEGLYIGATSENTLVYRSY